MTDFIVTITDPDQLAGITWARESYNASLPPEPPPMPDSVMGVMAAPPPDTMMMPGQQSAAAIQSDQEYVQWVMEQAAISYADQKLRAEYQAHYENAVGAARSGDKLPR
jgi:hypothetical protein